MRGKNDLGFVHLKIHLAATSLNKLLSPSENKKTMKSTPRWRGAVTSGRKWQLRLRHAHWGSKHCSDMASSRPWVCLQAYCSGPGFTYCLCLWYPILTWWDKPLQRRLPTVCAPAEHHRFHPAVARLPVFQGILSYQPPATPWSQGMWHETLSCWNPTELTCGAPTLTVHDLPVHPPWPVPAIRM